MADSSKIEWTSATWNPVTGCTKVSPGCDHCYAETFAERWRGVPGHHFEQGFDVTLRPERLEQPYDWRNPRRIFVNSMSDLFHEKVPDQFIAEVFAVMAQASWHTFQLLTKRHGRMRSLLSGDRLWKAVEDIAQGYVRWPLPNLWLGVSVEDQKWADIRVPALIQTPAAVRFLSCEPLLGPVDVERFLWDGDRDAPGWVHWVICGGESGPGARPMHPAWARSLRDQCTAAGVPFFFKQWGEWQPYTGYEERRRLMQLWEWPQNTKYGPGQVGGSIAHMNRVGKKAAGRELDGRTWDEFPRIREQAAA